MEMQASPTLLRRPPFAFAKRHGVIVARDLGDAVELVCRPGAALEAIQEARRLVRRPLRMRQVTPEQFDALLQRTYEGETGASAALAKGLTADDDDLESLSQALADAQDLLESDDDAPIIKFINGLLVEERSRKTLPTSTSRRLKAASPCASVSMACCAKSSVRRARSRRKLSRA